MTDQDVFGFCRAGSKTFVLCQFFHAVCDVDICTCVLITHVSDFDISGGRECVLRSGGFVVEAFEDVWAFDPEFAFLADGEFGRARGDVFGCLAGKENDRSARSEVD